MQPLFQEIAYTCTSFRLQQFADADVCLLASTNTTKQQNSRYSFLGLWPVRNLSFSPNESNEVFTALKNLKQALDIENIPSLPPFQGGIMGALAYDLGKHHVLGEKSDNSHPVANFLVMDLVIAFDHIAERCWLFSSGMDHNLKCNQANASSRLKQALTQLEITPDAPISCKTKTPNPITSPEKFQQQVEQTRQYIQEGDIFQANITQCFTTDHPHPDSVAIYLALQKKNPAPFSGFFQHADLAIISSSPERFIQINENGIMTTSPIKGSISRHPNPQIDQQQKNILLNSSKDKKENIMIVDLMRNDIGKVCEIGSVKVPILNELQTFQTVHHLVSTVTGQLRSDQDAVDALAACFPGGSITGAPKHRAMQIIDEIEPVPRGYYCGSLFYLNAHDMLDSSILIRSIIAHDQQLYFHAGAGITWDSDPELELEETLIKLKSTTTYDSHH